MENKKIILIIEDEKLLLNTLAEKFESEGFIVIRADDGEEGLQKAKAVEPDIILLDILMPKMDGLTMLNNLRHDGWAKGIPVFILTNVEDQAKMASAVDNLAQGYFIKSNWKLEDIVSEVKEKLKM